MTFVLLDQRAAARCASLQPLTQTQIPDREHFLSRPGLIRRSSVAHQLGLGDPQQIAQRADVHFLQAGASPNGKFEVRDGCVHQGLALESVAVGVVLDHHLAAGLHISHVQPGAGVVRVGVEDLAEATLSPGEVAAILVENPQVDERVLWCGRIYSTLVERECLLFFTHKVQLVPQVEHDLAVVGVGRRGATQLGDRADPVGGFFRLLCRRQVLGRTRGLRRTVSSTPITVSIGS